MPIATARIPLEPLQDSIAIAIGIAIAFENGHSIGQRFPATLDSSRAESVENEEVDDVQEALVLGGFCSVLGSLHGVGGDALRRRIPPRHP
jgi:hypothetical protein